MSRLIESIKLFDGKFHNLFYHEQRMARSLHALYNHCEAIDLEAYLGAKAYPEKGWYKCRIVYDHSVFETTFTPYEPKTIRKIKVVEDDNIHYEFKFSDRRAIDRLFERRGDCDDILIVSNGLVTDCSFSNIAFRKGENWYTPATALLRGTMRQNLLDKKKLQPEEITKNDIRSFDSFKIMNALLEFDSPEIEVSNIVF